jgi:hypothetical protein
VGDRAGARHEVALEGVGVAGGGAQVGDATAARAAACSGSAATAAGGATASVAGSAGGIAARIIAAGHDQQERKAPRDQGTHAHVQPSDGEAELALSALNRKSQNLLKVVFIVNIIDNESCFHCQCLVVFALLV